MYVDVYHHMASMGVSVREVDEMEIWQIAAAFGVHKPKEPAEPSKADSHALLRARMLHSQGKGPKPEPEPTPLEALSMLGDLGRGAFGR